MRRQSTEAEKRKWTGPVPDAIGSVAAPLVRSCNGVELWMELPFLLLKIEVRLKVPHQLAKFPERERLISIAQRLFRGRMDFYQESIRAHHRSGPRQHGNERSHSGRMTGINNDRQV